MIDQEYEKKWQEFKQMVRRHDLTYDYSDDGSVWHRGAASENAIRDMARQFPTEDVRKVWDEMVDRFLMKEARQPFYWKE